MNQRQEQATFFHEIKWLPRREEYRISIRVANTWVRHRYTRTPEKIPDILQGLYEDIRQCLDIWLAEVVEESLNTNYQTLKQNPINW